MLGDRDMKSAGGLQRRLETSSSGRALISGVILFTLAAMLISNLPASELRRTGMKIFDPYLDATGLHQNWSLFAPDPRRSTLQLEAPHHLRRRHDDGLAPADRRPGHRRVPHVPMAQVGRKRSRVLERSAPRAHRRLDRAHAHQRREDPRRGRAGQALVPSLRRSAAESLRNSRGVRACSSRCSTRRAGRETS